jgi:NADPH:quinone reductase
VANVTLRFVWLYGVPVPELVQASTDVAAALMAGALDELPVDRFPLSNVAEAHEAVEAGVVGKVLLDVA